MWSHKKVVKKFSRDGNDTDERPWDKLLQRSKDNKGWATFVREIILPGSGYSHPLKAEFYITQCGEFSWRLGSGWREEGASGQGGHWGACHEDSWGQRLLQAAQALPGLQFGESLKSPPQRPKHLYRDTWNWVPGVFRKCFWKSWNTSTHKIDTVPFTLCFPPNHSHDPPQ